MEKIIDAILKLFPFADFLDKLGVGKEQSLAFAAIISAILLFSLYKLYQFLIKRFEVCRAAKDLTPFFDFKKVKNSRELYIKTRYQNISPALEDEPYFSHQYVSKTLLIPFFLNIAFNEKEMVDRFYLILADSGMGKTTFMINLYLENYSFFRFKKNYKIRLFPFGDHRIMDFISKISQDEAKNTILLLDAFDEDKKILAPEISDGISDDERFRKRLDEIIEAVRDFRAVVITSRTQYFPVHETQTYELKIPRFDDKGYHKLSILYLSPFDSKEIQWYLNGKYGIVRFWNSNKKRNALRIVNNSPFLMVRPMLLSYIEYLVQSDVAFKFSYQVYETLIEKWIERESNKRKHSTDFLKFKQDLFNYSCEIAKEIYLKRKETDNLSVRKEDAFEIALNSKIELKNYEITGQSLLTRDAEGNWKFAHKSIFEYFIAMHAAKNIEFNIEFNFSGMDMAKKFYLDYLKEENFIFVKGGSTTLGTVKETVIYENEAERKVNINDFYICKYPVRQVDYEIITGKNPSHFIGNRKLPVESVSWFDSIKFCNLLNRETGYPDSYDESGNLLDKFGKITFDLKKVRGFRLPTEDEWEYAARGGEKRVEYTYSGSNDVNEVGWYDLNSKKETQHVGQKKENDLGLFDMSGNVWEWCNDWNKEWKVYTVEKHETDSHIMRGGSFSDSDWWLRCTHRHASYPNNKSFNIGFRLVFTSPNIIADE